MPIVTTSRKRKVGYVFSSLLIASVFFALYFFKYLPDNKEELDQRGFRILRKIEENVKLRSSEVLTSIRKNLGYLDSAGTIKSGMYDSAILNRIQTSVRAMDLTVVAVESACNKEHLSRQKLQANISKEADTSVINFYAHYKLNGGKEICIHCKNDFNKFISPTLAYRKDMFSSYLFIKDTNELDTTDKKTILTPIIYQSQNLGLGGMIVSPGQLLLNTNGIHAAGIHEMNISGTPYLMFFHPLEIGNDHLYITGMLPEIEYSRKYKQIPPGLIYGACIVLLLLIFSLPHLKLTMMTSREKLSIRDVVFSGVTLVLGVAVLSIMLLNWFFYQTMKTEKDKELIDLALWVEKDLTQKIASSYEQLQKYDNAIIAFPSTKVAGKVLNYLNTKPGGPDWTSPEIEKIFAPTSYTIFDYASWMNENGDVAFRWYTTSGYQPAINVKDRDFFKRILEDRAYEIKSQDSTLQFMIEPVYSRVSGDLKMIVSKESKVPGIAVASLSTRMFTELIPVVPWGYGFCIANKDGNVLVHSDGRRSLMENVLDETNQHPGIKHAMNKREPKQVSDIGYYGNISEFYVRPIGQLPLYIFTYYNKEHLYETNSHIIAFSICISGLMFLILLFAHRLQRAKPSKIVKLQYLPGRYDWFRPQKIGREKLVKISTFLLIFLPLSITAILITAVALARNSWVMLFDGLLLPFYTYLGLAWCNSFLVKRDPGQGTVKIQDHIQRPALWTFTKKNFPLFGVIILLNLFIAFFSDGVLPGYEYVILFQISVLLLTILSTYFLSSWKNLPSWNVHYSYSLIIALLLVAISIVPTEAFLIYAYDKDKLQKTKTVELQLARDLENRGQSIEKKFGREAKNFKESYYTGNYDSILTRLKTRENVFVKDSVSLLTSEHNKKGSLNDALLYENILTVLHKNEELEDSIYHLNHAAADSTWQWRCGLSNTYPLELTYYGLGQDKLPLTVRSRLNSIWNDVKGEWQAAISIFALFGFFLFGVYRLIRYSVKRIFLINYLHNPALCQVKQEFLQIFFQAYPRKKPRVIRRIRKPGEYDQ